MGMHRFSRTGVVLIGAPTAWNLRIRTFGDSTGQTEDGAAQKQESLSLCALSVEARPYLADRSIPERLAIAANDSCNVLDLRLAAQSMEGSFYSVDQLLGST